MPPGENCKVSWNPERMFQGLSSPLFAERFQAQYDLNDFVGDNWDCLKSHLYERLNPEEQSHLEQLRSQALAADHNQDQYLSASENFEFYQAQSNVLPGTWRQWNADLYFLNAWAQFFNKKTFSEDEVFKIDQAFASSDRPYLFSLERTTYLDDLRPRLISGDLSAQEHFYLAEILKSQEPLAQSFQADELPNLWEMLWSVYEDNGEILGFKLVIPQIFVGKNAELLKQESKSIFFSDSEYKDSVSFFELNSTEKVVSLFTLFRQVQLGLSSPELNVALRKKINLHFKLQNSLSEDMQAGYVLPYQFVQDDLGGVREAPVIGPLFFDPLISMSTADYFEPWWIPITLASFWGTHFVYKKIIAEALFGQVLDFRCGPQSSVWKKTQWDKFQKQRVLFQEGQSTVRSFLRRFGGEFFWSHILAYHYFLGPQIAHLKEKVSPTLNQDSHVYHLAWDVPFFIALAESMASLFNYNSLNFLMQKNICEEPAHTKKTKFSDQRQATTELTFIALSSLLGLISFQAAKKTFPEWGRSLGSLGMPGKIVSASLLAIFSLSYFYEEERTDRLSKEEIFAKMAADAQ